jgi:hypothetical protein
MQLLWTAERLEEHGLVAPAHREPILDAPQTLTELYDSMLAADPEKIAVVGRSGTLSFAALEAQGPLAPILPSSACKQVTGCASLVNDIQRR